MELPPQLEWFRQIVEKACLDMDGWTAGLHFDKRTSQLYEGADYYYLRLFHNDYKPEDLEGLTEAERIAFRKAWFKNIDEELNIVEANLKEGGLKAVRKGRALFIKIE